MELTKQGERDQSPKPRYFATKKNFDDAVATVTERDGEQLREVSEDATPKQLIEAAIQYAEYAHFLIFTGRDDGELFFHGEPPTAYKWPWRDKESQPLHWQPDWLEVEPNLDAAIDYLTKACQMIRKYPREGEGK